MREDLSRLLTRRELVVLARVSEGKTAQQISDALSIDRETVRVHKKHIMAKLGLHSTPALMRFVFENGLFSPKNNPYRV